MAETEWTRAATKGSVPSRVITHIMESLARADGDVDALIAMTPANSLRNPHKSKKPMTPSSEDYPN